MRTGLDGIPVVLVRRYRSLFVLPSLSVTMNASLEECERRVLAHPVFLVERAWVEGGHSDPDGRRAPESSSPG